MISIFKLPADKIITGNKQTTPDPWMHYMRLGEYDAAWKHSDEVMKTRAGKPCWHLPRHYQYVWNGESLKGKDVLVRCYHGLGDTIQFIRYAPLLKSIASKVIIWAQPELLPILKTVNGIDQLLPLHNGVPQVSYDADVEIMELPYIFRSTLATIPNACPYIHVHPIRIAKKEQVAVGLVWKAGDWDEHRSIPFSLLSPFGQIKGIDFYILQANAQSSGWQEQFGMNPGNIQLEEYARFVRGLDLLISVDSMPAHLAGALGVPVWTMLKADADWRWMIDREDSPWYPTMRLFRQEHPGEWPPVVSRIAQELIQLQGEP